MYKLKVKMKSCMCMHVHVHITLCLCAGSLCSNMLVVEGSWDVIVGSLGNMYMCALGVYVYLGCVCVL